MTQYFFAYGDRMSPERMAESVPEARIVGPARLPGFRLAFNVSSRAWGGGGANAVPDPAASMWGVLWDLGEEDPSSFDSFRGDEATAHGLIEVTVEGPDGRVTARTLCVGSSERFVRPTERHVAMLRANAERQGLPEEALEAIDRAAQGPLGQTPSI
jgi:hypothetical protein